MRAADTLPGTADEGWRASLQLTVARRDDLCVPTLRRHQGPLRLLKGYPMPADGRDRPGWEQILVHPPGGVASGDRLSLALAAEEGTHLTLTTPGAGKWYGARGRLAAWPARQDVVLRVADQASLEWLPMENIVYDGARAHLSWHAELAPQASLLAMDLCCLGRPLSQQPFERGELRWQTRIARTGRPLFIERTALDGANPHWRGITAMQGHACFGMLLAVPPRAALPDWPDTVSQLREALSEACPTQLSHWAVTALPEVTVLRWFGLQAEVGWQVLRTAWQLLRPTLCDRPAVAPRIWAC